MRCQEIPVISHVPQRQRRHRGCDIATVALATLGGLGLTGIWPVLAQETPVQIPLQHVARDADDPSAYDGLGIMVGINDSDPHLYLFDTGSDDFNTPIDDDVTGVSPLPGSEPGMVAYGNGSYGYWTQKVQIDSLSYFDPEDPSVAILTLDDGYIVAQSLDWVLTRKYSHFEDRNTSEYPVGYHDDEPVYADLDVRERMENGQPTDSPPFFGTFGAGDYIGQDQRTSALGSATETGYLVSANANLGDKTTPGCGPCLTLNLSPSLRSQFTALTPWGALDYKYEQRTFPQSGANASNELEGNFNYTITFGEEDDPKEVKLTGPILMDTGSSQFLFLTSTAAINVLARHGFHLDEYSSDVVGLSISGSGDAADDMDLGKVAVYRQANEAGEHGVTLGLPFFQRATVMHDLENRVTGYSEFFVTADNFSTDAMDGQGPTLNRATAETGSQGWLGLAGSLAGDSGFTVADGAVVRMSNVNTYTGDTTVEAGGFLYLAGPGSVETSPRLLVDGVFDIAQAGNYREEWGVPDLEGVTAQALTGGGSVQLGAKRLILSKALGQFDGVITDHNTSGDSLGGGLMVAGGKLTLTGDSDYFGLTEVAAGAELHVSGSLFSDVAVSGVLVVDGAIFGKVTVEKGGQLSGAGTVGELVIVDGGRSDPIKVFPK